MNNQKLTKKLFANLPKFIVNEDAITKALNELEIKHPTQSYSILGKLSRAAFWLEEVLNVFADGLENGAK